MGKTYKDMQAVMSCNNREFRYAYWQGKGHALGEKQPRTVIHPRKRQMTMTQAITDVEPVDTTFDTLRLAWSERR